MNINTKMRIVLKGYNAKVIDSALEKIISLVKQKKVAFSGPVPLPVERQIYTVNRSPHIDKTSREQFERKTHKRLLCVQDNGSSGFLTALSQVVLPAGVGVSLKYYPVAKNDGEVEVDMSVPKKDLVKGSAAKRARPVKKDEK